MLRSIRTDLALARQRQVDAQLARAQRYGDLERAVRSAAYLIALEATGEATTLADRGALDDARNILTRELDALGALVLYRGRDGKLRVREPLRPEAVLGPHDPRVGNCDPRFDAA